MKNVECYRKAQPDVTSRHGFAEAIFDEAKHQGMRLKVRQVDAINTEDYPISAKRTVKFELDCIKLEFTFEESIRPWKELLPSVIREFNHG